jgi:predicted nucleotidyltransferase
MQLSDKDYQKLSSLLQADDRIVAAYLLGSAATGTMRTDSDIDVAILPQKGLKLSCFVPGELAGKLSYELSREVDIGILSSANLVYSRQAIAYGKRLFTKDPFYSDLMETTLISMYFWFNEERKEILNAYRT